MRRRFVSGILVIAAGCASDASAPPPSQASRATPAEKTTEKPTPSPATEDAVVIKGSKPAKAAPTAERSAEEKERIARLEASAHDSQGKHTGGEPVAFKPEKPAPAADGSSWTDSLEDAKRRAHDEHRLVLAFFTGSDWCGWCMKLKKEVLDTPEFRDWASKNVVLLELDFPRQKPQSDDLKTQNAALAKQYGIHGYPTVVFFDETGKSYGEKGYEEGGPTPWCADAQKAVDNFKR